MSPRKTYGPGPYLRQLRSTCETCGGLGVACADGSRIETQPVSTRWVDCPKCGDSYPQVTDETKGTT